jgi:EAL domain-containing protein (putative c-di-GMP-specific phosphodiesterase class I)
VLFRSINTVEALLRWQQPGGNLISAAEFIRAAEETGLIDTIGEWMLQVAITQLKQWQEAGNRIKLAVNLSHRQLAQGDPAQSILRLLKETGIDPRLLQIEISESSLREGTPGVRSSLQQLKDVGVQIAVDDFSTPSGLSSLGGFPIHSIKIDRQYIQKISDPENAAVVSAILREAQNLGLNVVAEGVETELELDFLRSKLCPLAQGYLLGRPEPAAALTRLLLEGQSIPSTNPPRRRRPAKEKTP